LVIKDDSIHSLPTPGNPGWLYAKTVTRSDYTLISLSGSIQLSKGNGRLRNDPAFSYPLRLDIMVQNEGS